MRSMTIIFFLFAVGSCAPIQNMGAFGPKTLSCSGRADVSNSNIFYARGSDIIRSNFSWDFDAGAERFDPSVGQSETAGDIFWEQETLETRYLAPINRARFASLGYIDCRRLSYGRIQRQRPEFSVQKIPAGDGEGSQIQIGSVFVGITSQGRITKFVVTEYGDDLKIDWLTYKSPVEQGNVVR